MLSWLPIIGPILTPVINLFGKFFDDKTQVLKAETAASVAIVQATEEDWGVRLARDILIGPWALWGGVGGWDTLIAIHYPWLKFGIATPPPALVYMPYAVCIFLLGNIGLNMWKRG